MHQVLPHLKLDFLKKTSYTCHQMNKMKTQKTGRESCHLQNVYNGSLTKKILEM